MGGDGGQEERPGLARRLGTALAILLFIGLAGAGVRQASRLNPLSGGPGGGGSSAPGSLQVRAAADRDSDSEAPSLPPPAGGQWEVIPRSGLAPRSDPVTVWTGKEVFVWGGWAGEPPRRMFNDGALYDPVTRDWSFIRVGPPRGWQEGAVGVWTGAEVLILGGRHSIGQEPLAQTYDPARATWLELPRPPAGRWLWQTAVWTGTVVAVVEEQPHDDAVRTLLFDPAAGAWRIGPQLSAMTTSAASRAAWLDAKMIVSGRVTGQDRLMLQYFEPTGTVWQRGRGAPPSREWLAAMAADEAAGDVILAGPVPGQAPEFLAARWNQREGWRVLPEVPTALRNGRPPRLFATPAGPLLWPEGPTPPSVLVGDVWRPLPRAPRDKNFREAVVWTDHGLFAWGGHTDQHSAGGALYRIPALSAASATPPPSGPRWAGTWRAMPGLPEGLQQPLLFAHPGGLAAVARTPAGEWAAWRLTGSAWEPAGVAGRHQDACVTHVGLDVYVLGRDFDADAWRAGVLNVLDGAGRALPPPPVPVGGMVACAAWGNRVAVVSLSGEGGAGAVFDPGTARWTALPSLPPAGLLTGLVAAGSDDVAPLLLLTDLTVARLDPGGEWHLSSTPRNAFAASGPAVAWAGDRLLVWGGTAMRGLHGGWAWDAGRMVWGQIPEASIAGTGDLQPHAWSGRRWVVWGQARPGAQSAAAYEPVTRQWHLLPPSPSPSIAIAAVWDVDLVVLRADGTVERFDPAGSP